MPLRKNKILLPMLWLAAVPALRAPIVVVAPVMLTTLVASSDAEAHASMVKSVPAPRAVLYRSPGSIQLWFNERLEAKYSSFTLSDEGGRQIVLGPMEIGVEDAKRLSAPVKPLPPGRYTVRYRVLSTDGHVVQNQFTFTIRQ